MLWWRVVRIFVRNVVELSGRGLWQRVVRIWEEMCGRDGGRDKCGK